MHTLLVSIAVMVFLFAPLGVAACIRKVPSRSSSEVYLGSYIASDEVCYGLSVDAPSEAFAAQFAGMTEITT